MSAQTRSPSSALSDPFFGEGTTTEKKGTLILTSLLEDLAKLAPVGPVYPLLFSLLERVHFFGPELGRRFECQDKCPIYACRRTGGVELCPPVSWTLKGYFAARNAAEKQYPKKVAAKQALSALPTPTMSGQNKSGLGQQLFTNEALAFNHRECKT